VPVKEGTASHTARSVAARRLEYARVAAGPGDPAADDALSRDVADGLAPRPGPMHEYLRARTAFFDRVLVDSLDQGITQVVIGGAGYDGRALRYARPGVRWFEVDHPATQADKLERLTRLGVAIPHIRFLAADFTADPVGEPLLAAGLDPARPALFLFEGVVVYLDRPVTERVLAEFRAVTPAGSPLAVSVSAARPAGANRERFQQWAAARGEPARTVLTADDARDLLLTAGWEITGGSARQRSAGLLLARAVTGADQPVGQRPDPVPPASPPAPARPGPVLVQPAPVRNDPRPRPVTGPQAARLPLSALLSQALVAFTIEADNEAERRLPHRTTTQGKTGAWSGGAWLTSLLMYANCLRFLPDEGTAISGLRARARTGTNLDGMRRWGYVTFTPEPTRGKRPAPDAVIRPTDRGRAARAAWERVLPDIEARWRGRLGGAGYDALRAVLVDTVERLDPALPDCLPILGFGLYTRRDPERARPRGDGPEDTPLADPAAEPVAGLPLWALLSRPLVAFARQYEEAPGPSLAVSADVLRLLADDGVLVKDIPALSGVSKEAVAMAMTALRQSRLVTEGPDPAGGRFRTVRPTDRGAAARDQYPARTSAIEADWRDRYGDGRLTALRLALEPLAAGDPPPLFAGLAPDPDNWRAQVRPARVLPHYPMTLHRGGYPDGS
jgi:methyltransferase (TIGR00027 family)